MIESNILNSLSTPPSLRATSPIAHSCAEEEEVNTFGRFFGEGLEYTKTILSNYRLNRRQYATGLDKKNKG